jgi:hypothetical protein
MKDIGDERWKKIGKRKNEDFLSFGCIRFCIWRLQLYTSHFLSQEGCWSALESCSFVLSSRPYVPVHNDDSQAMIESVNFWSEHV